MITVDLPALPDRCTDCGTAIPTGSPAVYITGHAYSSRRFELILCGGCAEQLADDITEALAAEEESATS